MDSALVLYWDQPVDSISGPALGIAGAFAELGFRVVRVSIASEKLTLNSDAVAEVMSNSSIVDSDIVVSVGGVPMNVTWNGQRLYETLGKRFYLYSLDALIYDVNRVYGVSEFVQMARGSTRLGIMSPDLDNTRLVNELIGRPACSYVPFAGTFRPLRSQERIARVAVIGTMGLELAGVSDGEDFKTLVLDAPPSITDRDRLAEFADVIEQQGSPLNIVSLASSFLGLSANLIYTPDVSWYLCRLDAFQKRRRRFLAISQLRDVPVDFFGSGWEPYTRDFSDCRIMGNVSYFRVGDLCQRYAALLNFDTNWDYGLHPRVHTAIGSGCRVLTNDSGALADLRLPDPSAVAVYDGNDPDGLADTARSALSQPAIDPDLLHRFRQENSWFDRVDNFLTNTS